MRVLVCLALVACGTSRMGPTVLVIAEAGDAPEPNASVTSSRADGTVIEAVSPDATGRAEVAVEAGGLISVTFPSGAIATYPASVDGLVVHGPPEDVPPVVAAALDVAPMAAIAADSYELDLGCLTQQLTSLPVYVEVPSTCFGNDSKIDVLLRAFSAQQLAGYTAARLDASDGAPHLAPATWQTQATPVPIALDGVAPTLDWVLYADGLPFAPQAIAGTAPLWTGLVVDTTIVHAALATGQRTTLAIAGAPSTIQLAASDFLPALTEAAAQAGAALSWPATGVGADAIDLHMTGWDVVLPPDATSVTLPPLAPPSAATLRYLDSSDLDGFTAITDVHVEDDAASILPVPASGELRVTQAP